MKARVPATYSRHAAGRTVVAACALWRLLAPVGAAAADVRGEARKVAADIAEARQAGRLDAEAEQSAVTRLAPLVLAFIDQADRSVLGGREAAEREGLRGMFDAIAGPLGGIYEENAGRLDELAKKVMDEDGDLDALYESAAWRGAQATASQALYYLNWLNFYGARVSDGAARKALLEKAERGFSEFAVGDRRSELLVESVLGRGLCHLELGHTEWAERDFRIVIDSKEASAERRSKAKVALLDAYLRAGDVAKSLKASEEFAGAAGDGRVRPEEAPYLRFLRLRALLLAVKGGAAGADRYRQEAMNLVEQLRQLGGGWREKAEALLAGSMDNAAQWAGKAAGVFAQWEIAKAAVQKGDYAQAIPLLERLLERTEPEARRYRGDALYLLGLAEFQSGQHAKAAEHLRTAAGEASAEYKAEAAYLRFKAVEAAMARQADADLTETFRAAASEYVTAHPDHRSAFEAHLRLGELSQGEGEFARAVEAYAKVKGAPMFELRAAFATLQCRFELLSALDAGGRRRAVADEMLRKIGESLPGVVDKAAEIERGGGENEAQARDILAKATVLKAAYVSRTAGGDDEILALLRDYERKYPRQADAHPAVLRLRLEALERTGRFAAAAAELTEHGAALGGVESREMTEALAARYLKTAARLKAKSGEAAAEPAQQVARRLYELAVGDAADAAEKTKLTLARLYQEGGEAQKARGLYEEILARDSGSLAALRGLARLSEAENNFEAALGFWERYAAATRPGDPPWYDGQYELARGALAAGNRGRACEILTALRPAMPGLGDADLRAKLSELFKQACD